MPMAARGEICRIAHDSVSPPHHEVRNTDGNNLRAPRAGVLLERLGWRNGLNVIFQPASTLGALQATEKAFE